MLALSSNPLPETLISQERRELTFFMPNCDIFCIQKIWEALMREDETFKKRVERIISECEEEYGIKPSLDDICIMNYFLLNMPSYNHSNLKRYLQNDIGNYEKSIIFSIGNFDKANRINEDNFRDFQCNWEE
jgi:hypothetical protein